MMTCRSFTCRLYARLFLHVINVFLTVNFLILRRKSIARVEFVSKILPHIVETSKNVCLFTLRNWDIWTCCHLARYLQVVRCALSEA
jgi:hypothetical protein